MRPSVLPLALAILFALSHANVHALQGGGAGATVPATQGAVIPPPPGVDPAAVSDLIPPINPALTNLPPSPEERLASLEATVIGLEERIANLEGQLRALSRIAVTSEGPRPNVRCGSFGFELVNDIINRSTNLAEKVAFVSFYPGNLVFATWSECEVGRISGPLLPSP